MTTITASKTKWVETKIGDTCTVGDGAHAKIKRQAAGIIYLTSKNIKHEKLSLVNIDYISEEDFKKYFRKNSKVIKSPQIDDVLLCIIGASMGDSCFVKVKKTFGLSSSVAILRANESILFPKYLYYWTRGYIFQDALYGIKGGAAQGYASQEMIKSLPLNYPPLPTQCKIAAILSAYDRLIENNTRRIEILEEMARSIYREWFVKFRFPGHEQVQMLDSELGLIPEGWKLKKLDELGSIGRGKSKHRPRNDPSLYGGNYPFVQTGEVKEALLYITHYSQTYNEKGLAQSKLWEPKTLLLTIAANIAETAILKIQACFPDSIVGFVADSEQVTPEFIKFRIDDIKEKMQSFSRGTAQDNLSLDKIKLFYFLVPDKDYIILFEKYTAPLFSQVQNLLLKNANLRLTRDLLLPRLISGEIDVENLDINTGEIAA